MSTELVSKADTVWMLVSTLLVVLMAMPGLALFYAGLLRSKNALSMLVHVLMVFALVMVLWVLFGYSLVFSGSGAVLGDGAKLFLLGLSPTSVSATFSSGVFIPEAIFIAFQGCFAAIAAALIVGAVAERMAFWAMLAFCTLWFVLAYIPIAHMVWGSGGYLLSKGAIDFAGGTVVHVNAGIAGLVAAKLVGKRTGFGREIMPPHNLPLTMTGIGLLWVGWFGFNAGSNLEANAATTIVFLNTLLAPAAGILTWSLLEARHNKGRTSMLGAASGALAGLVGITPACGNVGPIGALVIGALTASACLWGVTRLKRYLKVDDTLDVFGIHGLGGIVGALLTAPFAAASLGGNKGSDYSVLWQLWLQTEGVLITLVWSGLVSWVILRLLARRGRLRVSEEDERQGIDISLHGETAYSRLH